MDYIKKDKRSIFTNFTDDVIKSRITAYKALSQDYKVHMNQYVKYIVVNEHEININ